MILFFKWRTGGRKRDSSTEFESSLIAVFPWFFITYHSKSFFLWRPVPLCIKLKRRINLEYMYECWNYGIEKSEIVNVARKRFECTHRCARILLQSASTLFLSLAGTSFIWLVFFNCDGWAELVFMYEQWKKVSFILEPAVVNILAIFKWWILKHSRNNKNNFMSYFLEYSL